MFGIVSNIVVALMQSVYGITGADGGTAFTGRVSGTDGVKSGVAKVIGGLAYASTAPSSALHGNTSGVPFETKVTLPAKTIGDAAQNQLPGIVTGRDYAHVGHLLPRHLRPLKCGRISGITVPLAIRGNSFERMVKTMPWQASSNRQSTI